MGASRENVNRTLRALASLGIIELGAVGSPYFGQMSSSAGPAERVVKAIEDRHHPGALGTTSS